MKIAILNGCLPHYDFGVGRVIPVIAATLGELGVSVENISLGLAQIPYFDGHTASAVDALTAKLNECRGIILATGSQLFAPSAIMQNFLEYLDSPKYSGCFAGKYCFSLAVSKQGGERSALEYLARIVQYSGGYDCARLGLQESAAANIANLPDITEIIEKSTEDFYRAVRSGRRYITPSDTAAAITAPVSASAQAPVTAHAPAPVTAHVPAPTPAPESVTAHVPAPTPAPAHAPEPILASAQPAPVSAPAPAQKINFDAFTERQEEDIRELTNLFAQKYSQPKGTANPYENLTTPIQTIIEPPAAEAPVPVPAAAAAVPAPAAQQIIAPLPSAVPLTVAAPLTAAVSMPRVKSVRQATASLPHYYQPQLAGHLTATIQFSIGGSDAFDGYLTISEGECEYEEGSTANPDVTIIADTAAWQKVLQGHNTAQKSFMIGGLKVRGNFMFLAKFDTLFKMPVL